LSGLAARDVVAGYGARVVLRGCDLALEPGRLVAIVGPNGAGKSTLLRVLAGLIRARRGSVTLDGIDLVTLDRSAVARRIAVVPQVFDTVFPLTVREIVALGRTARLGFFGRASRADLAAVDRALADLDLASLAERRIDMLSGGERQRAVLAMALAQEADVLLLDEPTSHLDPAHQLATLDLVCELVARRGLLACAVLHDLNLAATMASRIAVLVAGRVVRDGAPADVLRADLVAEVFGERLAVIAHEGRPAVLPRALGSDGRSA
jgi:iron complex transport system ATP-binding protein